MIYKLLRSSQLILLILAVFTTTLKAEGNPDEGKALFGNNCAVCHSKDMKTRATGPALSGFQDRWAAESKADLYGWIRNSQGMIAKNNARALAVWKEYQPTVMTGFPNLTDAQIESLFAYINGVANGTYGPKPTAPGPGIVQETPKPKNDWNWYLLFGVLAVIVYVLSKLIGGLGKIYSKQIGESVEAPKSFLQSLTSKGMITALVVLGVILAGYTTVKNGIAFGRQQNYQPDQPIKFSHATHAGLNKIDCQFCHDGARRSKHAVIPAMNTCMNCHKAIVKGSQYGTGEITKIFASVGYNPNTNSYIDNYDKMSEKDIAAIYKKWIGDNYVTDHNLKAMDKYGERFMDSQWNDIKSSLTNNTKPNIQGPVEWTRIHSLPDHVYFNHSQHVTVGGIECQKCHGKVETMDVVRQYSTLSMGWCINCHRETEVKAFSNNDYYLSQFQKYHDELKAGTKTKVTVEDIGGLECQKCHY